MTVARDLGERPGSAASRGAHAAGHAVAGAAANPWMTRLMRFGFISRGLIYLLPGILALRLALSTGGESGNSLTQTGALAAIGRQPMGLVMLVIVAVGLAGYALWGLTRAILDPLQRGDSSRGIVLRLGYAWSALVHIGLLVATVRLISGSHETNGGNQDWTANLLARPWGSWLVGIIGVAWIVGGGLGQIVAGWRGSVEKDLDLEGRNPAERWWAVRLGRIGIVSRGVVFTIIGIFLVTAAWHARAAEARGMDGALLEVLQQPFGRVLLALVSLGLIAFGVFSMLCARWMRVTPLASASRAAQAPSHRGQS